MKLADIEKCISDSCAVIGSLSEQSRQIGLIVDAFVKCLKDGGQILTAGNGGSAAEALHMAEELTGRFRGNRQSLPAVSLAADSTAITCIANDFGYDAVFSRQVEGLGRKGDMLVLFSTSGNARNLSMALEMAHSRDMKVMALLGKGGGSLAGMSDYELIVNGDATERIQEAHQVILHILLDAVEESFS